MNDSTKPSFQPDAPTEAMAKMHESLKLVDDLVEGVEAIRRNAQTYIPKAPDEVDENWKSKVSKAAFVNFYEKALDAAQGAAFSKSPEIKNFPPTLEPLLSDIDGAGSTFTMFAQESFWNTVHHGVGFILADYPSLSKPIRTLADKRAANARPYLTHIDANQVLAAYAAYEDGSERMTHFRFLTNEVVPSEDFMSERTLKVVIAYSQPLRTSPVTLTRYTQDPDAGVWTEEERVLSLPVIPVVTPYAWRTGFCTGKPALHVLAHANLEHFRLATTHAAGLEIACLPFIHAAGPSLNTTRKNDTTGEVEQAKFKLTPYKAAVTDGETKIAWVEATGSALAQASAHMKVLEEQMSLMGLTPYLTNQPGGRTATEAAINAAQASAQLKSIALAFSQSLTRALWLLSLYENEPATNVKVSLDASFAAPVETAEASASSTTSETVPQSTVSDLRQPTKE
jgi:hypothetical protein